MFSDMRRLPDDQRAALILFELGDHPHAEIATVLGVRPEKVKALIFQAREALTRGHSARNSPCAEVRELLATVRGKVRPRSITQAHIDRCPGCAAFEAEVRSQRAALALILPVALAGQLKSLVLGSAVSGGSGTAAAAAGPGGGGAILSSGGAGSGTAAGAAGTAGAVGTTGAAGTIGTVAAGAAAAGSVATAGAAACALDMAAMAPVAAATPLAASGGAGVAGGLASSSAMGAIAKIAIATIAVATGALAGLKPRAPLVPDPVSPSPAVVATNTALPSVSGSAVEGSALTASAGSWTGSPAPAFSYQWEDCVAGGGRCSPIAGATSSSYVLGSSDVGSTVEVVVTGANSAGSASAASPVTGVVAAAPATGVSNTALPSVSGSAVEGSALTASAGSWTGSPAPAFSYQWEDCVAGGGRCSPIAGATSSSYVLGSSDVGSTVEVVVTGANSAGSASAASPVTGVVAAAPATGVSNTALPSVSGSAVEGSALTASAGSWTGSPAPAFSYQWEDCVAGGGRCSPIAGATSSSYVLGSSDVGSTVEVVVTGANSAGSASAASPVTGVVAAAPATGVSNTALPSVSGSAVEGSALTASAGSWTGSPAPAFSYQWEDCVAGGGRCSPIAGATSSSYVLGSSDVGSTVEVVVTGANSAGSASAASPVTRVISAHAASASVTPSKKRLPRGRHRHNRRHSRRNHKFRRPGRHRRHS